MTRDNFRKVRRLVEESGARLGLAAACAGGGTGGRFQAGGIKAGPWLSRVEFIGRRAIDWLVHLI